MNLRLHIYSSQIRNSKKKCYFIINIIIHYIERMIVRME